MLYYELMQIKIYLRNYFLIFLLYNLISCSSVEFPTMPTSLPKVYKIDIQQGNEITSEMLMTLKPGMTKPQVRFILGTPLIQDTFHSERWDYVYIMRVDEILIEQRHVILNFVDEKLKNITGEVIPKKDNVQLGDELQKKKPVVGKEGFDESLVGVQDEKKDNNELQPSDEEVESLKSETLSPLIEDTELLIDKEPQLPVDTSESINEAIKQDIIDSLPEKDDAGYFDLLLEKIGF
jgi:outer membrane protein assembly factor BamE (lipoprotein component of BamABCDE complex)